MSNAEKKITANLPEELLNRAMEISGEGITPTLRKGLELIAAGKVYKNILAMYGRYPNGIGIDLKELRKDRGK